MNKTKPEPIKVCDIVLPIWEYLLSSFSFALPEDSWRVSREWKRFLFCKPKGNLKQLSWDYELNHQILTLDENIKEVCLKGDKNGPVDSLTLFLLNAMMLKNTKSCRYPTPQYLLLRGHNVWLMLFMDPWRPHQRCSGRKYMDGSFHPEMFLEASTFIGFKGVNYTPKAKANYRDGELWAAALGSKKGE